VGRPIGQEIRADGSSRLRRPWRTGGAAADAQGRLYFVGDWFKWSGGEPGSTRDGVERNYVFHLGVYQSGLALSRLRLNVSGGAAVSAVAAFGVSLAWRPAQAAVKEPFRLIGL
jgi:hypothetical protein